jgi:hypothetical protein
MTSAGLSNAGVHLVVKAVPCTLGFDTLWLPHAAMWPGAPLIAVQHLAADVHRPVDDDRDRALLRKVGAPWQFGAQEEAPFSLAQA